MQDVNEIRQAISNIATRIREKHGYEPRLGFEWEFQLLDNTGQAVDETTTIALLKKSFGANPNIHKIYKERAHGLFEIATAPQNALESADNLEAIQESVSKIAKENDWHLSSRPVVARDGRFAGSAGLHINSSLLPLDAKPATEDYQPSAYALWLGKVNPITANAAQGILEINHQTPLWSFVNEDDIPRLVAGDGTPKKFKFGEAKSPTSVVNIRNNEEMALEPHQGSPLPNLEYAYHGHLEDRLPGARMDPHVAAFRTILGTYHGLENPIYNGDALIDIKSVQLGDETGTPLNVLPSKGLRTEVWKDYKNLHLPEGNIAQKYVGDLYGAETLAAVEAQARNPHVLQLESNQFQWDPNAKKAVDVDSTEHHTAPKDNKVETPPASPPDVSAVSPVEPLPAHYADLSIIARHHTPPKEPPESTITTAVANVVHEEPVITENHAEPNNKTLPSPVPVASTTKNVEPVIDTPASKAAEKEKPKTTQVPNVLNNKNGAVLAIGAAIAAGIGLWALFRKKPRTNKDDNTIVSPPNKLSPKRYEIFDSDNSAATRSDGKLWTSVVNTPSRNNARIM